jgi:hypothetical protein
MLVTALVGREARLGKYQFGSMVAIQIFSASWPQWAMMGQAGRR